MIHPIFIFNRTYTNLAGNGYFARKKSEPFKREVKSEIHP